MSEPVLVIMAAGLGSRYGGGGLKQVEHVGPRGERIIDYSMYDAYKAGFRRVICVIKEEMLEEFKTEITNAIEPYMQVDFAFQKQDDIPAGFSIPQGRVKPWGTGHAALAGARLADGAPYAVINADDFYGREAYQKIYDFLKNAQDTPKLDLCMVGYQVKNTISEHGSVARGVCEVAGGMLVNVTERTHIEKLESGEIAFTEDDGATWTALSPETPVSMSIWGFTPGFTAGLEEEFVKFFQKDLDKNPLKGEFFLPFAVNSLLQQGRAQVTVLSTGDKWHGITYKVDRQEVVDAVASMTEAGLYPSPVWG